jgi:integrase
MADIDDRWYRTTKGPSGKPLRVPTVRHGKGKRWDVRWRDDAGRQRHKAFDRKADAERFLAQVTADLARGAYFDPRAGRVAFRTYAEQWRAAQVHRATTAAQVETHMRRHVYPTFGDRSLASVRPSEVQAWVRGLEQRLAPSTIEVVYSFVAGVFRAAVRDRLIIATPCVDVRLPKREPKRVEPLATERVEALIAAMPDRYRALVLLAAGTGLRQGECFGLEVDDVDWLHRALRVAQQLVLMPGGAPYIAPLKTPASYRTVPLPRVVIDALTAHLAAFPATEVEVLDTIVRPAPKLRSATLLFTTSAGLPLRRTRFSGVWRTAAKAARLPEFVTFHDLRHYYASLLIQHGESVKVVQKRLGHKSAVETLDTYSHLWPDSEDRTREAVDLVLGAGGGLGAQAFYQIGPTCR